MRSSSGFTLLEMLLTLAMCVVLMILISGAINFYVVEMSTAEQTNRQSQVATAVMQMIEDDLRMAIVVRPVDTNALSDVLAAAASPLEQLGFSGGSSSSGAEEGDDLPEETGVQAEDELAAETLSTETLDVAAGGGVLQTPGLIGNADQLQVDVSRLPRLEETLIDPALVVSGGRLLDRPSDIKTVSYFVQPAGSGGSSDALETLAAEAGIPTTESGVLSGGLVRREMDRAIHMEASSSGGLSRLLAAGEIIAPEITAIGFEYFDGVNWMPIYSTDDTSYLPPAVRVTMQMQDEEGSSRTFTHTVFLPMSRIEDDETDVLSVE